MDTLKANRVCVLIPCAGSGAYFRDALESVLRQSHFNLRVCVVDNASPTTKYRDVCLELADDRVEYRRYERRVFCTQNWQRCLEGVRDLPFYAFIHDDDIWPADYLRTALDEFARHPAASSYFAGRTFFRDDERGEIDRLTIETIQHQQKLNRLKPGFRTAFIATSNGGHMSAYVCRGCFTGFPLWHVWNADQHYAALLGAYGETIVGTRCPALIRIHRSMGALQFPYGGQVHFETTSLHRMVLLHHLRENNLDAQQVIDAVDFAGAAYWERIVRSCFSWPLQRPLLGLGRSLLDEPKVRREMQRLGWRIKLTNLIGPLGWILFGIAADLRALGQQRRWPARDV